MSVSRCDLDEVYEQKVSEKMSFHVSGCWILDFRDVRCVCVWSAAISFIYSRLSDVPGGMKGRALNTLQLNQIKYFTESLFYFPNYFTSSEVSNFREEGEDLSEMTVSNLKLCILHTFIVMTCASFLVLWSQNSVHEFINFWDILFAWLCIHLSISIAYCVCIYTDHA